MGVKVCPNELEVWLRLNEFGVPCSIDSIRDKKTGADCKNKFKPVELTSLASGADEALLAGISYKLTDSKSFSVEAKPILIYYYKLRGII